MRNRFIVAALVLCTISLTPSAHAQAPKYLSLTAGPSSYDLSGTGTAPVVAASFGLPITGPLLLESGVSWFRYGSQFGPDVTYLFPEMGLQLQGRVGRLYPFIGVGGGRGFQIGGPSPRFHAWTLHAIGGFRVALSNVWGIRGDMRVRSVDPFHGVTADFTAGVTRFFP